MKIPHNNEPVQRDREEAVHRVERKQYCHAADNNTRKHGQDRRQHNSGYRVCRLPRIDQGPQNRGFSAHKHLIAERGPGKAHESHRRDYHEGKE